MILQVLDLIFPQEHNLMHTFLFTCPSVTSATLVLVGLTVAGTTRVRAQEVPNDPKPIGDRKNEKSYYNIITTTYIIKGMVIVYNVQGW